MLSLNISRVLINYVLQFELYLSSFWYSGPDIDQIQTLTYILPDDAKVL